MTRLGVPVLRRVIEAMLVFDHGFEPRSVTAALQRLRQGEYQGQRLYQVECTFEGEKNHVYCMDRKPTAAELRTLARLYRLRSEALNKNALKRAGERYVRAALLATCDYEDVTQEKRLGKVRIGGKHALDLLATGLRSGIRYGVSIKNERAWLHPGSRAIKDVFNKAMKHRVSPWLVVAFATEAAALRCGRDGIRLTVLGHRVAPRTSDDGKRLRPLFERIRPVLGPEPFEFLAERPESLGPVWLEERWQKFLDNEPAHAARGAS